MWAINEGDAKLPLSTGTGIGAVVTGTAVSFCAHLRQEYTCRTCSTTLSLARYTSAPGALRCSSRGAGPAARAELLLWCEAVLYRFHGQVGEDLLAATLALAALVGDLLYGGFSENGVGHGFGLVGQLHPVGIRTLTGCAELAAPAQTGLLLKPLELGHRLGILLPQPLNASLSCASPRTLAATDRSTRNASTPS